MTDAAGGPSDARSLEAIRQAVIRAEQAESDLQRAIDAAHEDGVADEAIRLVLAGRDSAGRAVVRGLVDILGPTYVAALARVTSTQEVLGWVEDSGPLPGPAAARRLRLATRVWDLVTQGESADAARAWFLRPNPELDGDSPLTAIKKDRAGSVLLAARSTST